MFAPVRSVASLFALGLMMALFHRVTAGAALEARASLALGFLFVAALLGGDLNSMPLDDLERALDQKT